MALTKIDDRGLKTPIDLQDNEKIRLGTGNDLQLYHSGTNSVIDNNTGSLYIRANVASDVGGDIFIQAKSGEDSAKFTHDGSVELRYDGTKKFETTSSGVTVSSDNSTGSILKGVTRFCPSGSTTVKAIWDEGGFSGAGHLQVKDGVAFSAGDSSDLKIYHDGTHSYLSNGTGNLFVEIPERAVNFQVQHGSETIINGYADGRVELYHDNSKKCSTTSTGIEVHGSTDNARISFGDAYANSSIGYVGLNRFGIDTHDGLEVRDVSASYATRLKIDQDGNCMINSTVNNNGTGNNTPGFCFQPQRLFGSGTGHAPLALNRSNSGIVALWYRDGSLVGNISVGSGSVSYNSGSDYRLKENVINLTGAIDRLKTLAPKRFNFIADPTKTVDGFIAHEVTAVPEAVTGTKDEVALEDNDDLDIKKGEPIMQQIDQSKLVPLLTAALQEAIAKIETLETKVAALEAG